MLRWSVGCGPDDLSAGWPRRPGVRRTHSLGRTIHRSADGAASLGLGTTSLGLLLRDRDRISAHRLLIYWWYDRSPARLGRGDRRGRSLIGCPPPVGVAQ